MFRLVLVWQLLAGYFAIICWDGGGLSVCLLDLVGYCDIVVGAYGCECVCLVVCLCDCFNVFGWLGFG